MLNIMLMKLIFNCVFFIKIKKILLVYFIVDGNIFKGVIYDMRLMKLVLIILLDYFLRCDRLYFIL